MASPQLQEVDSRRNAEQRRNAVSLLRRAVRELGWRYWFFCCATLSLASATLLPPELFRTFTTSIKADQFDIDSVIRQIAIFGGLIAVVLLTTSFLNILCREWLRLNLQANLRRRVLRKLHALPVEATDEAERGEWMTRMTADLSNVETFMTESIPEQMRDGAVVIGVGALFTWHFGTLALLPIGAALFLAVVNYWIHVKLAPVLADLRTLNGQVFGSLIENFEGRKTIHSLGGEEQAQAQFEGRLSAIIKSGFRVVRLLGGLMAQNRFVSEALITIALSASVWSVGAGTMTLAEALIVPFYIGMFFASAQGLAHAGFDWNRYFAEGGRLASMLAIPQKQERREMSQAQAQKARRIEIDDMAVGYRGKAVAEGLGFTCERGQTVALVGPSGCGKSTALEVLAGLRRPHAGIIRVFDKANTMLWETGCKARLPRTLTSLVEQRPYIFSGSVRENLLFGLRLSIADDELWQVLNRVGMANWLQSKDLGLDFMIADRGDNLSEGQRYRLALARALLTPRPYLLLDEPFAALDDLSVQRVLKALAEERDAGRGVIVVTHIMPTGFLCDDLVRFDALEDKGTRTGVANLPGPANMPPQGGNGDRELTLLKNLEVQHAQRDRS